MNKSIKKRTSLRGCKGDIYSITVRDHSSIFAGGESKIINCFDLSEGKIISELDILQNKIRDMFMMEEHLLVCAT